MNTQTGSIINTATSAKKKGIKFPEPKRQYCGEYKRVSS